MFRKTPLKLFPVTKCEKQTDRQTEEERGIGEGGGKAEG